MILNIGRKDGFKRFKTEFGHVLIKEIAGRDDGKVLITGADFNRYIHEPQKLNESEQRLASGGHLILSGKLQCAGVQNQNGREYDKNILQREMQLYNDKIEQRLALGELDHPDDSVINLQNVSHLITKMWWGDDGQSVMGNVLILNTPSGKILKDLHEARVPIGMSSRGLGSVSESNGIIKVNSDFQLICFDAVSEPSTPGA